MRTVQDNLKHCELTIEFAMNELTAGRTFYDGYFENKNWNELSRTDRALCILQSYLGHQELGDPKGFEEIRRNIHATFLKMKEKENEHS